MPAGTLRSVDLAPDLLNPSDYAAPSVGGRLLPPPVGNFGAKDLTKRPISSDNEGMSKIRTFWAWAIEGAMGAGQRQLVSPSRRYNHRRYSHRHVHEVRALASRPLEPRRLLDAALPGIFSSVLDFSVSGDFTSGGPSATIQVSQVQVETLSDSTSATPTGSVGPTGTRADFSQAGAGLQSSPGFFPASATNTAPQNVIVIPLGPGAPHGEAAENETVQVVFAFQDPDFFDTHTVAVDWGDGSPVETKTLPLGQRLGVMSHQYLDDNPSETPWDSNTIQMTVRDSHGEAATGLGKIRINNVGPSNLQLVPLDPIDENSLANLQLTFEDPGTLDTHQARIDWGDGSALETWDVTPGSRSLEANHTYADNGLYTLQVQLLDDDLGMVTGSVQQQVLNVAPTLSLTTDPLVVDEGSMLTITNLGTFTDPGFDNPHGVPATSESFSYTIDWGDGTVETGQLPVLVVPGSPGVPSTGLLAASHRYLDNNVDASHQAIDYKVIVRLRDDDGGVAQRSVDVTVNNVDPTLLTLTGTDIDRLGETTLSGQFVDPGNDTFVVQIDWRDGTIEQVPLGGPTPRDFSVTHRYFGPPDPQNPAADVEIGIRLLDDDRGFDTGLVAVSNTGDGTRPVRIDTTPQVPRLAFPRPLVVPPLLSSTPVNLENGSQADISSAVGDTKAIGERYFVLRVITPEGRPGAEYRLKAESLHDLPGLFRKLPDNHYAIYLVRPETETYRLVLEVNVRNGKVIDPGDDSDGARDRPPTESVEEPKQPVDVPGQGLEATAADSAAAPATPDQSATHDGAPRLGAGTGNDEAGDDGVEPAGHRDVAMFRPNFFGQIPDKASRDSLPDLERLGLAAGGIWLATAGNGETHSAVRSSVRAGDQEVRTREIDRRLAGTTPARWRRLRRLARQRPRM